MTMDEREFNQLSTEEVAKLTRGQQLVYVSRGEIDEEEIRMEVENCKKILSSMR
jgi:hypothetical protein